MQRRTRSRSFALAAATLVVAAGLSGCTQASSPTPTKLRLSTDDASGSNNIDRLDTNAVIQRVLAAVGNADTVHLAGSYSTPAPLGSDGRPTLDAARRVRTISIDLQGDKRRFTAKLASGPMTGTIVRVDGTVYVTGDATLATALASPAVATGYVAFHSDDPRLAPWLVFTDVPAMMGSILDTSMEGVTFAKGASVSTPVPSLQIEVSSQDKITGTVTVSTVGQPVPVALAITDPTGQGTFTFSQWGKKVSVQKPPVSAPAS